MSGIEFGFHTKGNQSQDMRLHFSLDEEGVTPVLVGKIDGKYVQVDFETVTTNDIKMLIAIMKASDDQVSKD